MSMKKRNRWIAYLMTATMVIGSMSLPVSAQDTEKTEKASVFQTETNKEKGNFNRDWKFFLGDESDAADKGFDDSDWENIQLPHDFSMDQEFSAQYEAESGFLPGGTGWYRKSVIFPEEYDGQVLTLNFDGVYNHAYVYVNGTKIGENFYGYNDFSLDISDYVTCDGKTENVISVKAVNEFPSSRWYSGSGIYRDVTLSVSGNVHVADKGTYVTTPNLEEEQNGDVTVHVETDVKNDSERSDSVTVRTTVLDEEGNAVSDAEEVEVTVGADAEETTEQDVMVNKPALWDCENPNLYYVQTEVLDGDEVLDTYETEFGFRYIEYTADEGFILNGENVKMKGVCMHHDLGALGAASYYDAVKRQVEILKGMGCNAIRSSHNIPSDMLISICNEEGILVMDEIFDGWTNYKNGTYNDFGKEFNKPLAADNQVIGAAAGMTWAQFALESTIDRDKNDPSVVMWSIGNELPTGCVGGNNCQTTYPGIAANLIKWIQDIDDTKPITQGDNQSSWGASDFRTNIDKQLIAAGGVVGLNYYPAQYANKHRQQPTWPMVGTETASPANSRGIYNTQGSSSQFGDYQCTSYDTASVSWGNTARESWYYTIANDYIAGEFIWTGFDYIGEPTGTGAWNGTNAGSVVGGDQAVPNSCFFGVIDTAGFPKDSYYFYSSQWVEDKTTLHIVPQSWNEEDLMVSNGKVPVYLYSNAAKVELFLNGEKIGTSTRNDFTTAAGYTYSTYTNVSDNADLCTAVNESTEWKRMAAQFNVKYEEGTLSAKAYDEEGNLIEDTYGLDFVTTNSDKGSSLKVETEKTEIQADGTSLSFISVDVMDKDDVFVSSARNNIRFSLTGNGTIVGVDNGNPSTTDKFQQPTVLTSDKTANIDAFSGKALVIVRSTEKAGGFTLKAESSGLTGAQVTVNTVGEVQGPAYIKDYEITKDYSVKMGTAPELQKTAAVTMSDGSETTGTLSWTEVSEDTYSQPGDYTLKGVLSVGEESVEVEAFLHVLPIFSGFKNYSRATSAGVVPTLPKTVTGILENGDEYGEYEVVWDELTSEELQNVDDVITVKGIVKVSDEDSYEVYANVRVAEGVTMDPVNVAPLYAELTESCGQKADNLLSIVNGVKNNTSSANERWTNWNDHLQSSSPFITFTWDEAKEIDDIKLWFYTDASVKVPEKVTIEVAEDGLDFREVEFTATEFSPTGETDFKLKTPQSVKGVRITMTQQGNGYVGLKEAEIWTTAFGYTMYDTAELESLTVDGKETVYEDGYYTADVKDANQAVIVAKAKDNAAVTVVPANEDGVAKVIVQSEDQNTTNEYLIKLNGETKEKAAKATARGEVITEITYEEIPQSVMKADCSATSFKEPTQYNDGGPENAFDGNAGTAWHTQYVEKPTASYDELPQSIEFGLGGEQLIGKLSFVGKTPQGNNGLIKDATVYAKTGDGEWTEVQSFSFEKSAKGGGEVVFDEPFTADRIKITVTDSYNEIDYKLACIGDIHVYKAILPEPFAIDVAMNWNDSNNKDGDRPENIKVGLMVDGQKVENTEITLSADNDWTASFENVDPNAGDTFDVYCMAEDFDSSKEAEGYVYTCAGSVNDGFVITGEKSFVLNTEVHWLDNDNADGKRPSSVALIYKGGDETEFVTIASSDVLADVVKDSAVVPKYQTDGSLYDYTVSGGLYTNADWEVDSNVTANEDGIYVVNYKLGYVAKEWNVTFNVDGQETNVVIADGETIGDKLPKDPTKDGYNFVGWNTSVDGKGDVVTADTVVTDNMIVYAIFEKQAVAGDISTAVLEYALELADKASTEGVISSVVERFEAAKTNGQEILDKVKAGDTTVSQADVDASWRELITAMQYLSFKMGDKTDLEKVVALAKTMEENIGLYVEETTGAFLKALVKAEETLADGDAMQEDIDTDWQALLTAMAGLRLKADKDLLKNLVSEAEGIEFAQYTEESVQVFKAALASAKSVLEDNSLSEEDQATVDQAAEQLTSAKQGLEKIQESVDAATNEQSNSAAAGQDGNSAGTGTASTTAKSAKTGDMGQTAAIWMLLLMAAGSACVIVRRRKMK